LVYEEIKNVKSNGTEGVDESAGNVKNYRNKGGESVRGLFVTCGGRQQKKHEHRYHIKGLCKSL
jgi:hypothetical protein